MTKRMPRRTSPPWAPAAACCRTPRHRRASRPAHQHLGRWVVPASVAEQLQTSVVSAAGPARTRVVVGLRPRRPVSGVDVKFTDHVASENAFQTTTSIAELIATLDLESARELARGGIQLCPTASASRRPWASISIGCPACSTSPRAGLVALDSGRWMPAEASRAWMVDSSGERWALLATRGWNA